MPDASRVDAVVDAEPVVIEMIPFSMEMTVIVISCLCIALGWWIGETRARQAAVLESEQNARLAAELNLARAKSDERTRIAREMHDSLAHHLSLVALHAGAIEMRDDLSRTEVRAAVGVIGDTTREALTELRAILGVLRRPEDGEADEIRRPTADDVRELVDAVRAAGSAVDLRSQPADALDDLPHGLDLHVFRFVQEVLTNARKHAPGAGVHIEVRVASGDRVDLAAWNAITPDAAAAAVAAVPSGFGLTGLGERMRLAGGELSVVSDETVFGVTAWMPWPN